MNKIEKSIPNARGRRRLMKDKRLSSKKVRKLSLDSSDIELKLTRRKIILDR